MMEGPWIPATQMQERNAACVAGRVTVHRMRRPEPRPHPGRGGEQGPAHRDPHSRPTDDPRRVALPAERRPCLAVTPQNTWAPSLHEPRIPRGEQGWRELVPLAAADPKSLPPTGRPRGQQGSRWDALSLCGGPGRRGVPGASARDRGPVWKAADAGQRARREAQRGSVFLLKINFRSERNWMSSPDGGTCSLRCRTAGWARDGTFPYLHRFPSRSEAPASTQSLPCACLCQLGFSLKSRCMSLEMVEALESPGAKGRSQGCGGATPQPLFSVSPGGQGCLTAEVSGPSVAGVRLDSSGLGRFWKSLRDGGPPCRGHGVFRPDALSCCVGQTDVCLARAVAPDGASEPAAPAAAAWGGAVGRVCG